MCRIQQMNVIAHRHSTSIVQLYVEIRFFVLSLQMAGTFPGDHFHKSRYI